MEVQIKCKGAFELDVEDMHGFQGGLKELTKENYEKLRGLIEEHGYSFASHVWKNPEDKKWYLLDGHQRSFVLKKMRQEGWKIPLLPVVQVQADSFKQAKEKVLAGTSQFGEIKDEGLYEFLHDSEIDTSFLENIRFPEIDFEKFNQNFFVDDTSVSEEDFYSKKIEAPIYEIKGEKPSIEELSDNTKAKELITEIEKADISEEVKNFLYQAAQRHVVFNYQNIAEYYAHAPKHVQELMEKSALVIIDFNKAIEYGFVQLTKDLSEEFPNDEG